MIKRALPGVPVNHATYSGKRHGVSRTGKNYFPR